MNAESALDGRVFGALSISPFLGTALTAAGTRPRTKARRAVAAHKDAADGDARSAISSGKESGSRVQRPASSATLRYHSVRTSWTPKLDELKPGLVSQGNPQSPTGKREEHLKPDLAMRCLAKPGHGG
ncbi:hypothetical protein B0A54_13246 [Friedmanniomyces endolithicus]|uniref:Uncharacterized protein n=1 Tax=Friedmanniomyces endolithicus TaxID=329885 RepID=A0A4U0UM59_9PEZI|nr:hypothetical protein B0A54_13246 [Friedmanniomyces endolithicus]